jgi:energy-coupling factor transporter ATP-binding protein EcfA2
MLAGSGLSGESTKDQECVFLIGKGSSGKSTGLKLVQRAITDCYFKELKHDTFTNENKADKVFNTFYDNPQILVIFINEPKDAAMESSIFKTFVEGQCNTTMLYKDGSHSFEHKGKIFLTSNLLPRAVLDGGIIRRILATEHHSLFVKKDEEVNEAEWRFKEDTDLMKSIEDDPEKRNAIFDILAENCNEWLSGKKIPYTQRFKETKDTIIGGNDHIQDFIDSELIITKKIDDRIGKMNMMGIFNQFFKDKRPMSTTQLISALKDRGLTYNGTFRHDGLKGCFTCVRERRYDDDEPVKENPLDKNVVDPKDLQIEALLKQIEELKQNSTVNKPSNFENPEKNPAKSSISSLADLLDFLP